MAIELTGFKSDVPVSPTANPFSSQFVSPKSTPFVFADGAPPAAVASDLARFLQSHLAAGIIGPHGTGKSTALQTLLPLLRRDFTEVRLFSLNPSSNPCDQAAAIQQALHGSSPVGEHSLPTQFAQRCIAIDGFEQLSWFARKKLVAQVRWLAKRWVPIRQQRSRATEKVHLLITAHHAQTGVPTFLKTSWDDAMVQQLTLEKLTRVPSDQRATMRLAAEARAERIRELPQSQQNIRDYWFALYDDYERLRRQTELHHPRPLPFDGADRTDS